jgi:hypothetical protein
MRPLRRRLVLPALMTLALAVAACGAGDDPADDPSPPPAGTDATTDAEGEGDVPEDEAGDDAPDDEADDDAPDDEADRDVPDEGETTGGQDELDGAPGGGDVPGSCPEEVLEAGEDIAAQYEHVEVGPGDGLDVLTCEWRAEDNGIASVEVSFSGQLIGMDLADLEHAEEVTVAGVDGHVMHSEEGKVNMFQFQTEGLFITGGSIDLEDIDSDDVLVLAEAAIEALTS